MIPPSKEKKSSSKKRKIVSADDVVKTSVTDLNNKALTETEHSLNAKTQQV